MYFSKLFSTLHFNAEAQRHGNYINRNFAKIAKVQRSAIPFPYRSFRSYITQAWLCWSSYTTIRPRANVNCLREHSHLFK